MFLVMVVIAAGAQATAGGTAHGPVPVTNPGGWFSNDDYPPEALRARLSGPVAFRIDVDAAGAPTGCTVTTSSNAQLLDDATCALMLQRARFNPAVDAAGKPVASSWSNRIRWQVPATTPAAPPPPVPIELPNGAQSKIGASDVTVNADGIIEACRQLPRPYQNVSAPPDICAMYPVGTRFGPPTVRNGHPQRRRVQITITTVDTYIK
jgi:TonB family protein